MRLMRPSHSQILVMLLLAAPAFAQSESFAAGSSAVFVGRIPCEMGVVVNLEADSKTPGEFILRMNRFTFQLQPVETSTGVIRLEDRKAGAVWLQLSNKSMLMNQKLGRRMADECMSPVQQAVAEAMKANPVPGLLDPVAAPPAAPASASQPSAAAAPPATP